MELLVESQRPPALPRYTHLVTMNACCNTGFVRGPKGPMLVTFFRDKPMSDAQIKSVYAQSYGLPDENIMVKPSSLGPHFRDVYKKVIVTV